MPLPNRQVERLLSANGKLLMSREKCLNARCIRLTISMDIDLDHEHPRGSHA